MEHSPSNPVPTQPSALLRLGLTGGIGSGKSTVAQCLVDLGAHLVDTDAIARELTAVGGLALPAIAQAFGPKSLGADGALDREHMRSTVFSDPQAKKRLEAILHPLIGQMASQRANQAHGRTVVFDVPLLAESSHWRGRVQKVLVVDCQVATQIQRVAQRPGWTVQAAQRVVDQQAPRRQRRQIADAVIWNEGISMDDLRVQVQTLLAHWPLLATHPSGR